MVRKIGNCSEKDMKEALQLVENGKSLREAAVLKKIAYATLRRYWVKRKDGIMRYTPNYNVNQVFTDEQEKSLLDYLLTCSKMFYGLPLLECRRVAFEMAVMNNTKTPEKWQIDKLAGKHWLLNFRKRHPQLSLRTPEGCSLSRATSFNKYNVNIFYDKLYEVMNRNTIFADGTRIFNLDESSCVTVQRPQKVLAERGIRQVSKVTSAERGTLMTICCIISASGQSIPPAMIFPRVHFKQHMLVGSPSGTLGLATPTGWMNSELFLDVMKHFIKHTCSSKENPTLLIYDNYEAHLSLPVLELAKTNGVTILTIPPHSTSKLQPLDVGVFKPFKTAYNASIDSWMMQNPGKPISIYEIASCVGLAYQKSVTPTNIISAFKKTGIYPYDRHVFTDIDFLPSFVTDRVQTTTDLSTVPSTSNVSSSSAIDSSLINLPPKETTPEPSTSSCNMELQTEAQKSDVQKFISPDQIRGYPKAGPRKAQGKKRRKGRSIIATDTPEKDAIAERNSKKNIPANKKVKKIVSLDIETTEDNDLAESEPELQILTDFPQRTPIEEDFVLVKFNTKNGKEVFYVGKVIGNRDNDGDIQISFLRKSIQYKFVMPNVPDFASVPETDVRMILPKPSFIRGTSRQKSSYNFGVDFSLVDVR